MGFKSKVFGFLAAAGLSVSLVAGASADFQGTATLSENTCGSANTLVDETKRSFGNWKFNGTTGYALVGTPGEDNVVTFGVMVSTVPSPTKKCKVVVNTQGLTQGTETIGSSHFQVATGNSSWYGLGQSGHTVDNVDLTQTNIKLKLNTVPGSVDTGDYKGQIVATTVVAQ